MAAGKTVSVAGDNYLFLATGQETEGAYSLFDALVPPSGGPPLHRHSREAEAFYVIEGSVEFTVDGETRLGTAGSFFHLPAGSVHRFQNVSSTPARMLILVVPSGMEAMFEACGTPVDGLHAPPAPFGPVEIQKLLAVTAQFGVEILAPASH